MREFPERLGFSRSNAPRFGPTEQTQRIDDEHRTALETSPSRLRHSVIKRTGRAQVGYLSREDRRGQTDVPTSTGTRKTRRRHHHYRLPSQTRNPRKPSGQLFDRPSIANSRTSSG
ncbi:hypothetical protein V1478_016036 [Vespula squamosa]|uniref:Uncharacterized protein n=1 Tax=Vespula squamosa TaxID=30214 RepID=A0ABD2A2J8_VESSQ